MIIELSNEIKYEIIKLVLDKKGLLLKSLPSFDTTTMLIQLKKAISRKGYSLDDIDDQVVTFEVYDYKLDISGITGRDAYGKWFSFGLLYDFTDFTEDIDSIYLINPDGSDDILVL